MTPRCLLNQWRFTFQPAFDRLVNDAVGQMIAGFSHVLHSIHVYASVAESRATENLSDLDLTVKFTQELDDESTHKMAEVKSSLEKAYPVVSKIDIDLGTLDMVLKAANKNFWVVHSRR